jgi:hypothetical protein
MQDWWSWFNETKVQLVTTPPTRLVEPVGSNGLGRTIKSSAAVALKSLTLGKERTLERIVEVKRAAVYIKIKTYPWSDCVVNKVKLNSMNTCHVSQRRSCLHLHKAHQHLPKSDGRAND